MVAEDPLTALLDAIARDSSGGKCRRSICSLRLSRLSPNLLAITLALHSAPAETARRIAKKADKALNSAGTFWARPAKDSTSKTMSQVCRRSCARAEEVWDGVQLRLQTQRCVWISCLRAIRKRPKVRSTVDAEEDERGEDEDDDSR